MTEAMNRGILTLLAGVFAALALSGEGCAKVRPEERLTKANDAIVGHRYEAAQKEYLSLLKDLSGDDARTIKLKRKTLYRLGRLNYLFLNQPEQAIDYYRQVITIDPRAPLSFNALAGMGKIYQDTMRDYPQAVLAYQTLTAYFPKHRHIDRYRRRLIETYFKMGNFSQVRSEGMAAVAAMQGSQYADDVLYLVAEACLMEGDKDAARATLERITTGYPNGEWASQAHYELGEICISAGDNPGALRHFEAALPGMKDSAVLKRKIGQLTKKAKE
jgi:tetratricopeptide (TPR) repeat protein